MAQTCIATGNVDSVWLDESTIHALSNCLSGTLITADDAEYHRARAVWNGMIDRRPALIVRCANTNDVVQAVNFARTHNVLVSVRGGGHNVAGSAVCDGGLVIDLSCMKELVVDPDARIVRAGAGLTWAEVDRATQVYGLAAPGGLVSDTGIAGLTLSGGTGWLRNKHGLSCDNLLGAEVVTADGQVRNANAAEHPDLYWALRGGGGNFGVVTRFDFRLHPVGPEVALGMVFYPISKAWEALRFFDRYAAVAPDEVSCLALLGALPLSDAFPAAIQGEACVLLAGCYSGPIDEGERILQPLRQLGTPLIDFSAVMPFVDVQQLWDADYPAGTRRYYWKSIYLNHLGDTVIDTLLQAAAMSPSHHSTLDIWHMGGALARVPATATAFGRRDLPYMIGIEANWDDPLDDDKNLAWARHLWSELRPSSSGSVYLNFPGFGEEGEALVRTAYGENYARLAAIKRIYDPANLFRMNLNIRPMAE